MCPARSRRVRQARSAARATPRPPRSRVRWRRRRPPARPRACARRASGRSWYRASWAGRYPTARPDFHLVLAKRLRFNLTTRGTEGTHSMESTHMTHETGSTQPEKLERPRVAELDAVLGRPFQVL